MDRMRHAATASILGRKRDAIGMTSSFDAFEHRVVVGSIIHDKRDNL